MSRLRTGHTPADWRDDGPSQGHVAPRTYIGGSLVVAGPVTGPVMGFWRHSTKKTPEEIAEARARFHPTNRGRAA